MELLAVALAPSLLWLWYFWRQGETREGAGPMARAFCYGAVCVIPAVILEVMFSRPGSTATLLECFLVIGPAEELSKMAATLMRTTTEKDFDEPSDGIVLAAAVALGFAFAENLGYFAGAGSSRVLIRTALSVPGHVLFAVPYGAALGRLRMIPGYSAASVVPALLFACALHGAFDALLFHVDLNPPLFLAMFLGLVVFMWKLYRRLAAECAAEGRALFANASPTPVPEPPAPPIDLVGVGAAASAREPFRWGSAFSAFGYGVLFFTLVSAGWEGGASPAFKASHNGVLGVLCILGLMAGGLVSAYRSPGYTVRESAAGLAILGVLLGGFSGPGAGAMLAVMLGLLGAFGGWLGEALQSASER